MGHASIFSLSHDYGREEGYSSIFLRGDTFVNIY